MDPTEKGWLPLFLQLRIDFPLQSPQGELWSSDKIIYKYLQPTGIIYGHPIELPKEIDIDFSLWPVKERLEVIFLESLIYSYLVVNEYDKIDKTILDDAVVAINKYFETSFPEYLKTKIFEAKAKDQKLKLEKILAKRITVKPEWNAHFWRGFFHNILLFLDVIVFTEFLNAEKSDLKFKPKTRLLELQASIIHLLAIILDIDAEKNKSNSNFLHFFIDSTILNKKEKEDAKDIINSPNIDRVIQCLENSNWIIKKYFLELATLSIWADNSVNLDEEDFINKFSKKLNLNQIDIEESTFAVESFVLHHWQQVHYLQSKQNYLTLSKRITQRMIRISKKYGKQIKQEIEENKELIDLLKLSQKRTLSIEEKEKVRIQLIDILKTIPAFIILALPMSFLTVPILMKVLPKDLFPSSFDPNKIINTRGNNIIEE